MRIEVGRRTVCLIKGLVSSAPVETNIVLPIVHRPPELFPGPAVDDGIQKSLERT